MPSSFASVDHARLYAKFVLSNQAKPSAEIVKEALKLKPRVDLDAWVEDAEERFSLQDRARGGRDWEKRARIRVKAAFRDAGNMQAENGGEPFDDLTKDDTGRCLFPFEKLASYHMILHAVCGMVCMDHSSPLVEAKYSQRPLNTMLIATALLADVWTEWFTVDEVDENARDMRIEAILDEALDRCCKITGFARWLDNFLGIKIHDGAKTQTRSSWLRAPMTFYAAAASYAGYGYCLQNSTARLSQAYALSFETQGLLESDSTAATLRTPQRTPPDWLEVFILESIFQIRAPDDVHPKVFAKACGKNLVYKSEDAAWEEHESSTIVDDAQASHSAAIVPYHGKRPHRPEDDVFFGDFDFGQVAAQESGKRKRAREEKKRRSKEQAVERELLSGMTAEQVLAMRGAR
tara:strand:- start:117 stop:1334 length:1218 start_codon:yes stop_codon:yes gene_type:complete